MNRYGFLIAGLVVGLLVGAGGGYLWAEKSSDFEKKKDCIKLGRQYFEELKQEQPYLNPTLWGYTYNPRLDTCLCCYAFVGVEEVSMVVDDALGGGRLLTFTQSVQQQTDEMATPEEVEFRRKYKDLTGRVTD